MSEKYYLKCVYKNCRNTGKDVSLFRMPVSDKERLEAWIRNSGNKKLLSLTSRQLNRRYMCEVHFCQCCVSKGDQRKRLIGPVVPVAYESTKTQEDDALSISSSEEDGVNIKEHAVQSDLPSTIDYENPLFDANIVTKSYSRRVGAVAEKQNPSESGEQEKTDNDTNNVVKCAENHNLHFSEFEETYHDQQSGAVAGKQNPSESGEQEKTDNDTNNVVKCAGNHNLHFSEFEETYQDQQSDTDTPRSQSQFSWQKISEDLDETATASGDAAYRGDLILVPDICEAANHSHIEKSCNVCKENITGFRYACVQCADCDLCGACEARGRHAAHYVLRIPRDKTHNEAQEVLKAVRKALATAQSQHDADTSLLKQEDLKAEDPSTVEGLDLDVLADVGDPLKGPSTVEDLDLDVVADFGNLLEAPSPEEDQDVLADVGDLLEAPSLVKDQDVLAGVENPLEAPSLVKDLDVLADVGDLLEAPSPEEDPTESLSTVDDLDVLADVRDPLEAPSPEEDPTESLSTVDDLDVLADVRDPLEAPSPEEDPTESLSTVDDLDVLADVGDPLEMQEECLDRDSNDGTDNDILSKRKITPNESTVIKIVSPKKLKHTTDETGEKSPLTKTAVPMGSSDIVPTAPSKTITAPNQSFRMVKLKKVKVVTDKAIRRILRPIVAQNVKELGSSDTVPTAPSKIITAPNKSFRGVNLKKVMIVKNKVIRRILTPIVAQKGSTRILPIVPLKRGIPPKAASQVGIKKLYTLTSTVAQQKSSQSNTGTDTGNVNMDCLPERSCLLVKNGTEFASSDEAISSTHAPARDEIEYPTESSHVQNLESSECPIESSNVQNLELSECPTESSQVQKLELSECPTESSHVENLESSECPTESSHVQNLESSECPTESSHVQNLESSECPMESSNVQKLELSEFPTESSHVQNLESSECPMKSSHVQKLDSPMGVISATANIVVKLEDMSSVHWTLNVQESMQEECLDRDSNDVTDNYILPKRKITPNESTAIKIISPKKLKHTTDGNGEKSPFTPTEVPIGSTDIVSIVLPNFKHITDKTGDESPLTPTVVPIGSCDTVPTAPSKMIAPNETFRTDSLKKVKKLKIVRHRAIRRILTPIVAQKGSTGILPIVPLKRRIPSKAAFQAGIKKLYTSTSTVAQQKSSQSNTAIYTGNVNMDCLPDRACLLAENGTVEFESSGETIISTHAPSSGEIEYSTESSHVQKLELSECPMDSSHVQNLELSECPMESSHVQNLELSECPMESSHVQNLELSECPMESSHVHKLVSSECPTESSHVQKLESSECQTESSHVQNLESSECPTESSHVQKLVSSEYPTESSHVEKLESSMDVISATANIVVKLEDMSSVHWTLKIQENC